MLQDVTCFVRVCWCQTPWQNHYPMGMPERTETSRRQAGAARHTLRKRLKLIEFLLKPEAECRALLSQQAREFI